MANPAGQPRQTGDSLPGMPVIGMQGSGTSMRHTLRLSAALFALIIFLLAGLNWHVHTNLRDEAIRSQAADLTHQAQVKAQDVDNSLQAIRFKLEQLALQVQLLAGDDRAIHAELKQAQQSLAYVRALAVTDAAGILRHSSRTFPAPRISLRDRPNVAAHLNSSDSTFFFGDISRNLVDQRWQYAMSIAVRDAEGRLEYIVSSVLDPYAYAASFAATTSEGDYVALLDRAFTLIARSPWRDDLIGATFPWDAALQPFAASGYRRHSGIYVNPFTGGERIVALRPAFDGQLVITASRALEDALANWRSLATIISAISAAIVVLGTGIGLVAYRFLALREREAEALAELNEELLEQTARAERAAAVKGDFLATMSHEIRTPMNGVLGMAQAMERLPLDDNARDYLSIIRDSSESLLGVINDILDFSRMEAGKLKIEPVTVRLAAMLEAVEALFVPACEQKKLAFRIEIAPDTPAVIETDHMRLRQILMNLIGNAVKFTASGHVLVWVAPATLPDGRAAVRFEIEDTGIGVSPEAMPHLFERFSQEDASTARRFGGTGLGLAICKRLCELLGGRIGCRSEKNVGSVFWFELPQELALEDDLPEAPPPSRPVAAGDRLRILAVDDNRVNRRVLEVLLQPFGHALTFATSGAEALGWIEQQPFDAALLDIHMPDMDGFETLRRLRRLPHGRHLRVLALTADVVPEAKVRYSEAGFDDVVAKPVVLTALLAALQPQRRAVATQD